MQDYVYRYSDGIHEFIFLETGTAPFRVICDHFERIIIAEDAHAHCIRYLLDLRLADFQEPMYEVVAGLRGITTRHPNRPASSLALVARPHPINRFLNVTVTLISRKIDRFKLFESNSIQDALDWLKPAS